MSIRTISEDLFEKLCSARGIGCARIPESDKKTADYEVSIDSLILITEVKQLDPNERDKKLIPVWGAASSPSTVAPSDRVQGLIAEAYPQIKASSQRKRPGMIVVYNNSGQWNWIDAFTVAKAMFGSFGIVLKLQPDQTIGVAGHGYLGKRKVTKDTFRSLSVVGVLKEAGIDRIRLDCYHTILSLISPLTLLRFRTWLTHSTYTPTRTKGASCSGNREKLKHSYKNAQARIAFSQASTHWCN